MGKFTAFKEDVYPSGRPAAFPAAGAFAMESAKSLAWAAQLAYETANKPKLDRILTGWGWQRDAILDGVFRETIRFTIAGGFVAHVGQTTIVAFAGTEPEKPAQWIEDFSIQAVDGMHKGFRAGVEAVWKTQLAAVIDGATEIYFCGHSLGGALCAAAAHRLCREKPEAAVKIRGVYTMGMPRVGTDQFAREYNGARIAPDSTLGQRTFRFVHGKDIVPHVPPAMPLFDYRHVGRAASCPPGGRFAAGDPGPVATEGANADDEVRLSDVLVPRIFPDPSVPPYPAEDDNVADAVARLPPAVRDHLMDRYLRALGAL